MHLKILHGRVGSHVEGDIVPVSAVHGGYPEAERLAGIGAAAWTAAAPTVELPAVADAVLEMTDDELLAENARLRDLLARAGEATDAATADLRNQLAVLTAQRDALLAELEAARKPAPARAGRKKKGEATDSDSGTGEGAKTSDPATDAPKPADLADPAADDTALAPTEPTPTE